MVSATAGGTAVRQRHRQLEPLDHAVRGRQYHLGRGHRRRRQPRPCSSFSVTRSTQVCRVSADFNGDCGAESDLAQHGTRPTVGCGTWSGTTYLGSAGFPTVVDQAWRLAASADFNQDGAPDLIWRNTSTGQNAVWYLRGTTYLGDAALPTLVGSAWQLVMRRRLQSGRRARPDLAQQRNRTECRLVFQQDDLTSGTRVFPHLPVRGGSWRRAQTSIGTTHPT